MDKPTRAELNAAIDAFLKDPRKSSRGGGWAEIQPGDVDQLDAIIEKLIRLKSEEDADGDLTIEWQILDRQRFQKSQFDPVPYKHGFKNKGDGQDLKAFEEHYSRVTYNLSVAMSEFKNAEDWRRHAELKFASPDKKPK